MTSPVPPTRRQAVLLCVCAALTAVMCAALLGAAALIPAPPVVLPFLVVIGVGCPMAVACEVPGAIAVLRAGRDRTAGGRSGGPALDGRALETLRRQLAQIPETQHPLGL
jgi:hypothetical protein